MMAKFEENIAAAVDALGVQAAGIVWGVASTYWDSDEHRDAFLAELTKKGDQNGQGRVQQ